MLSYVQGTCCATRQMLLQDVCFLLHIQLHLLCQQTDAAAERQLPASPSAAICAVRRWDGLHPECCVDH